jgi:hypothetical protein
MLKALFSSGLNRTNEILVVNFFLFDALLSFSVNEFRVCFIEYFLYFSCNSNLNIGYNNAI